RDETAMKESDIETEIVCQLAGGINQFAFDLNSVGIEFEHGSQASDNAKPTAPFAKQRACSNIVGRHRAQNAIGPHIIAGNKSRNARVILEAFDASVRFTQECTHVVR